MGTAEETWNIQRACYAINLHLGDIPVRCSVLHTAEEYFSHSKSIQVLKMFINIMNKNKLSFFSAYKLIWLVCCRYILGTTYKVLVLLVMFPLLSVELITCILWKSYSAHRYNLCLTWIRIDWLIMCSIVAT